MSSTVRNVPTSDLVRSMRRRLKKIGVFKEDIFEIYWNNQSDLRPDNTTGPFTWMNKSVTEIRLSKFRNLAQLGNVMIL